MNEAATWIDGIGAIIWSLTSGIWAAIGLWVAILIIIWAWKR